MLLTWRAFVLSTNAATSFNKHRRHVRALLNFALREGLIASSPLLKVSAPPVGKKRPKTVSPNWVRKAHELMDANPAALRPVWFWRAVINVMYFGLMRRRQVVELTWEDINFRRTSVTLSSEGSKSRKEWDIPLPKRVMDELAYVKKKTRDILGRPVEMTDQVFCFPLFSAHHKRFKTTRMTEAHLSAFFIRLSRLIGYRISPHRVRHTSATIMLSRTDNLKSTSEMLGHSTIALTADTYIHPSIATLRKAQRRMPYYSVD